MHKPVCKHLPEYWQANARSRWCPFVDLESSTQQDRDFSLTGSTDVWHNILADLQNPKFCQKSLLNIIPNSKTQENLCAINIPIIYFALVTY
jgi:hypothetical protein